jgi:hypothetical protein
LAIEIRRWAKNFPDASGRTHSGLADESYVGCETLQGISAQKPAQLAINPNAFEATELYSR